MIKNGSGQKIGAGMVSATTGAAFTGAVTVYVTGDAGTQAVGSVGAGACVHEGNGYHSYAPSQAESNYDLIAFTFIGTGAIPQTVQVETRTGTVTLAYAQGFEKNVAFPNFSFMLYDADGLPVTGRTVTATRKIDAGAFAACANAVSEISGGLYSIDLAAADLNGAAVAFRATASGARQLDCLILPVQR